jgi:hypothetical protein
MTTIRDDSLRKNAQRITPAWKLPRGNYPTSEFMAPLVTIEQDVVQIAPLTYPYHVWMLLFMSDTPIVVRAQSFYADFDEPYLCNFDDFIELCWLEGSLATNPLILADDNTLDLGQQATGLTVTNAVRVQGYMARFTLVDRGIENTNVDVQPAVKVRATSGTPVVYGPPTYEGATNAADFEPIILAEDDYTAAMYAAHNIITDAAGVHLIVGLWDEVAPA